MFRVAIVEDEIVYARILKKYLMRYQQESGEKIEITIFSDGDEIVETYRAQFEVIFMDVQMQFMDGMTAAGEIRKTDPEVAIIFITNMAQFAIGGYAVDALDYLLKPVSYAAMVKSMNRAITRIKRHSRRYMIIAGRDGTQKLDISKIWWIESQGHKLIFHTENGDYCSNEAIKDVEEKLKKMSFFRCNKGYLVNLEYVENICNSCAIVKGTPLLISRARKNEFMEALTNYVDGADG
ncbi:MAG TPA: LytTR family DNA-binding domain-containing protein [Mobilitalea sp.]|nr:LytTR family DNA-binding domain-containing protein [Mobilitalea sp.]